MEKDKGEKNYYIRKVNFQKSYSFLYPLIGFRKNDEIKPHNTYLYWSESDYSIEDYNLLVYYKTDFNKEFKKFEKEFILTKDNIVGCFIVEGGILYIFDLISYANEVSEFLEGNYSKYGDKEKRKVMAYYGDIDCKTVKPGRVIHMALWPELYYSVVSEELGVPEKDLSELMDKYNIKDEICYLPIIENVSSPEEKTIYFKKE